MNKIIILVITLLLSPVAVAYDPYYVSEYDKLQARQYQQRAVEQQREWQRRESDRQSLRDSIRRSEQNTPDYMLQRNLNNNQPYRYPIGGN
jgi:hypothetical protein